MNVDYYLIVILICIYLITKLSAYLLSYWPFGYCIFDAAVEDLSLKIIGLPLSSVTPGAACVLIRCEPGTYFVKQQLRRLWRSP